MFDGCQTNNSLPRLLLLWHFLPRLLYIFPQKFTNPLGRGMGLWTRFFYSPWHCHASKWCCIMNLGHSGSPCPSSHATNILFHIVDTNGIHQTKVQFCACEGLVDQPSQLMHAEHFPATMKQPTTLFTFCLLCQFHQLHLEGKISTHDFMGALRHISDNAFLQLLWSLIISSYRLWTTFHFCIVYLAMRSLHHFIASLSLSSVIVHCTIHVFRLSWLIVYVTYSVYSCSCTYISIDPSSSIDSS